MKYTELKTQMEKLGFIIINDTYFSVEDTSTGYTEPICYVSKKRMYQIDTDTEAFIKLSNEVREKIGRICWELASTPIKERSEPKRYYIHRVPELGKRGYLKFYDIEGSKGYAKGSIRIGKVGIDVNNTHWKPIFTMKEIRELEVKYDEDYSGMLEEAEED